jgi:molecular chaperone GrpE (heat shock protein)
MELVQKARRATIKTLDRRIPLLKVKKEGRAMHGQIGSDDSESEVIPFVRAERSSPSDGADQLDKAGQTILQMLHRAAGVAEENSRHALETAQKLSHQLRASENRVAELEAEVAAYQERAERAEQWLHRVYTEIEDRFLRQNDNLNGAPQRSERANRR